MAPNSIIAEQGPEAVIPTKWVPGATTRPLNRAERRERAKWLRSAAGREALRQQQCAFKKMIDAFLAKAKADADESPSLDESEALLLDYATYEDEDENNGFALAPVGHDDDAG